MEKDLSIGGLYEYYSPFLTKKQADVIDLYYNQDLSLGEIAQELNISRQAVLDHISRGKARILDMESKFHLANKSKIDIEKLAEIKKVLLSATKDNYTQNINNAVLMLNDMIENRM